MYVDFPCQYRYSSAPRTFIALSPTVLSPSTSISPVIIATVVLQEHSLLSRRQFSLRVRRFPLPLSLQQCSRNIHCSLTDSSVSEYVDFPCHYRYSSAPGTFIALSPTVLSPSTSISPAIIATVVLQEHSLLSHLQFSLRVRPFPLPLSLQ